MSHTSTVSRPRTLNDLPPELQPIFKLIEEASPGPEYKFGYHLEPIVAPDLVSLINGWAMHIMFGHHLWNVRIAGHSLELTNYYTSLQCPLHCIIIQLCDPDFPEQVYAVVSDQSLMEV